MTPFELALESELTVESQRFDSEWLFKWYGLTYEGGKTDVDDFKGGRIRYGGIVFGYQQQDIFWQAIGRYVGQKVHEIFRRWDTETHTYPAERRLSSLDGTERIAQVYVRKVLSRARETAKAVSKGAPDTGYSPVLQGIAEASRLAQAHRELLKGNAAIAEKSAPKGRWKWIEEFFANNKGLIWFLGLVASALAAGITVLLKLYG